MLSMIFNFVNIGSLFYLFSNFFFFILTVAVSCYLCFLLNFVICLCLLNTYVLFCCSDKMRNSKKKTLNSFLFRK